MFGMSPELFLLRIPVILIALTVHEVAHAWTALRLGDPTARDEGRITLNPLPHLDMLGTLMLMTGLFGWAKPVPVNGYNLRNPKRDMMLISVAGPLSNIILAICFGLIIRIFLNFDPQYLATAFNGNLWMFLRLAFQINCGLAFFNMLPFYPLDGSKVLMRWIPDRHIETYIQATQHALPVIFGLVIIGAFTGVSILSSILGPIFLPFLRLMWWIAVGQW